MGIKSRISYATLNAVKHSAWYTQTMFPDCRKFWDLDTFNLDVVNLGSTSGVRSFDYAGVPVKGANWALRRNYLFGDRAILENYLSYLKPGATVIIPLCPFSSLSGRYSSLEDRYYTILNPSSIPGFSKSRQTAVADIQKNPVHYIPAFQIYLELRRKLAACWHRPHRMVPTEETMVRSAKTWLSDWLSEFSLRDLAAPLSLLNRDAIDDAVGHLNVMMALCRDRGFNTVLVFPPMYHTLAEKFSPEAREMLIGSIVSRLDDKDVRFLNYMDDPAFTCEATLFDDAYLMNAAGARKFTRMVLQAVGLI